MPRGKKSLSLAATFAALSQVQPAINAVRIAPGLYLTEGRGYTVNTEELFPSLGRNLTRKRAEKFGAALSDALTEIVELSCVPSDPCAKRAEKQKRPHQPYDNSAEASAARYRADENGERVYDAQGEPLPKYRYPLGKRRASTRQELGIMETGDDSTLGDGSPSVPAIGGEPGPSDWFRTAGANDAAYFEATGQKPMVTQRECEQCATVGTVYLTPFPETAGYMCSECFDAAFPDYPREGRTSCRPLSETPLTEYERDAVAPMAAMYAMAIQGGEDE